MVRVRGGVLASALLLSSAAICAAAQVDPEETLARGEQMVRTGDYTGAVALFSTLQPEQLSDGQRGRFYIALGGAHLEMGRYDDALASVELGERSASRIDDANLLARLEGTRAAVWRARGYPLRAIDHFERALSLAERSGISDTISRVYLQLSACYQMLGDWARVLDYAERSFRVSPNPTDVQRQAYLGNRGIALYEFHDRDGAHESFTEALAIARRRGDRRGEQFMLGELGLVAWELDRDRERALRLYAEAIEIAAAIKVAASESVWWINLGNVYRDTGELEEALRHYRRSVAIEERLGTRTQAATAIKNIGQVLSMQGRLQEPDRFLREAVALADAIGNQHIRWQARMELATLHAGRDSALAERYFAETLDLLEERRTNVLLENFRAGQLSRQLSRYDPYERYIEFLLGRGGTRQAFVVAERARARAFLDTLGAARQQIAGLVPASYTEEENEILRQISQQQAALRDGAVPAARRVAILAAVRDQEDRLAALRTRLASEQPAIAHARYPRIWNADQLQAEVLARDEALLMFFLGRERSTAWLVQPGRLEVMRLPGRAAIEAAVTEYLDVVRNPSRQGDREAGSRLFSLLLADIAPRVPDGTRLVVVPHGILHYVPFEALPAPDGRFLLERAIVSYAPSVSSFAFLRRLPPPREPGRGVIAVGNPTLRGDAQGVERSGLSLEWAGLLTRLPYAQREIRRIARSFRNGRVLDGDEATEPALAAAGLDRAAALHFATHALVDEQRPERSGLALTATPPDSDGLLQVREVYRLRLPSALVTLSACQTALGRNVNGEGMVGLTRAFFYAGANAVTASLWSVSDASTASLMEAFYEQLGRGEPVDRALRNAKLSLIASGGTHAHPFYWAAFVAIGDGALRVSLAPAPLVPPAVLIVVAATLSLVAGGALLRRQRRRKAVVPAET